MYGARLFVLEGFSCCFWDVSAGEGDEAQANESKEGEELPNVVPLETSYS